MPDGSTIYGQSVLNVNGYVVMLPNVGTAQDIIETFPPNPYAESVTKLFPLGTKLIQGERVWRYCENGAGTLGIGAPISAPPSTHADLQEDIPCGVGSAIGEYVVSLTSSTDRDTSPDDEDDNFAEGYLHINDEAGQGQCFKIKSNEGFTANANEVLFTLYDPLTIATTTSTEFGVIVSPYHDVVVCPTAATMGMVVGVPGIAVTANYFFWSQTGGVASVVPQAAIALGNYVIVGTTAGKVNIMSAVTTEFIIGWPLTPGIADTEQMLVFLTLDR